MRGTTGVTSGVVVVGLGEKVGNVELNVATGAADTEALFVEVPDVVSDEGAEGCRDSILVVKAGAGWRGITLEDKVETGWAGRPLAGKTEEGREEEARLVLFGINEEGNSGKLDPGRLNPPFGKEELKAEYCICCIGGGIDNPGGGIDNPGGGRSNDWWCI